MQKGRKLWEKALALVLAVVCCLSIINLAPLAGSVKEAEAATAESTFYYYSTGSVTDAWCWSGPEGNIAANSCEAVSLGNNWYRFTLKTENGNPGDVIRFNINGNQTTAFTAGYTQGTYYGYAGDTTAYSSWDAFNTAHSGLTNPAGGGTVTETFTFTFKDGTNEQWLSGAKDGVTAVFDISVNGSTIRMNKVDETTWTATLPSNVGDFTISRGNGSYVWNTWNVPGSSRGTSTTYTATGDGTGSWTGGSTEPSEPSTEPIGSIYGTPLTDATYEPDLDVQLESMTDVNGRNDLIVEPAIIYNYNKGGGSAWWNQFADFNKAIVDNYAGAGKITHQLVVGAPDTRETSGDEKGQRSLKDLAYASGMNNRLWYYNHNLAANGIDANYNDALIGAPMQGLVGEYLSTDGELLSSENNVVMPFFDDNFLTGRAQKFGTKENPVSFPFRVREDGYYVFDSASDVDNVHMDDNGKLVYDSSSSATIKNPGDAGGNTGFFPFNTTGDATKYADKVSQTPSQEDSAVNYGFGVRLDIPFNVPTNKADASTPLVDDASVSINNSNVSWMTFDLGYTLQPGNYQLVLKRNGGAFALTRYMAGDASSTQPQTYFKDHKGSAAGYQAFPDIDGGTEAFINLNGNLIVPITVTEATSKISVLGKTWGDVPFGVSVYEGTQTPVLNDDITFHFSGDDDLWVYVDGRLALDVGGCHGRADGMINFSTGEVTVTNAKTINSSDELVDGETYALKDWLKITDNQPHRLTVFYMERGLYDSNLKIEFNFSPIQLTARDTYYAEVGTPIEMDVPDDFKDLINSTNYTITSDDNGTVKYENGKFSYTSDSAKDESFTETVTVTFDDEAKSHITYVIHNYKMNDDVYVIDYGIPVELKTNDAHDLFNNDKLVNSTAYTDIKELMLTNFDGDKPLGRYTAVDLGVSLSDSVRGSSDYGTATYSADPSSYKYSLDKFLDTTDSFYYAAQVVARGTAADAALSAKNATPIMMSKVTIVPASVVYYEDNFSYDSTTGKTSAIIYSDDVAFVNNTSLPVQSNNNDELYGYDEAYTNFINDSLGGSQQLTNKNTVQFTFNGTGFDIIARTAGDTGTILYTVFNENKKLEKAGIVDTYYNNGSLYQLPVISVKDLEKGKHTVKFVVKASGEGDAYSYVYFDGIRIYNPLDDANAQKYYNTDEYNAEVKSIRSMVLGDGNFTEAGIVDADGNVIDTAAVNIPGSQISIVDGSGKRGTSVSENLSDANTQTSAQIAEILHSGPNSEIYLDNQSSLAFYVTKNSSVADDKDRTLQVEVKAVATGAGNVTSAGLALTIGSDNKLADINTATAMYYNIPLDKCQDMGDGRYLVVINGASNNGCNLSFTNLKVKGYDITAKEAAGSTIDKIYAEKITCNGKENISVNRRTEITFNVTFTGAIDPEKFTLVANGKDVYVRAIEKVEGTDNQYAVKTISPNAVGKYTYNFVYENTDGTKTSTSVNVQVNAGRGSRG